MKTLNKCKTCGKEFNGPKNKKYCEDCQTAQCKQCGREVARTRNFCSRKCSRLFYVSNPENKDKLKECQNRKETKLKKSIAQKRAFENRETQERHRRSVLKTFEEGRETWNKGSTISEEEKKNISVKIKEKWDSGHYDQFVEQGAFKKTEEHKRKLRTLRKNGGSFDIVRTKYKIDPSLSSSEAEAEIAKQITEEFAAEGYEINLNYYLKTKEYITYKCPKGHIGRILLNSWRSGYRCRQCGNNLSKREDDVYKFISRYVPDAVQGYRPEWMEGQELDIYIPSKRIAIEYCGIYWHSSQFKNSWYHYDKFKKCEKQDVQLITIFSDELEDHQCLVENMILYKVGVENERIKLRASKCSVQEITTDQAKCFLNEFHLDGYTAASIKLGLFHNNTLVSVITLRNPINKNKYSGAIEVARFASDFKYTVYGGLSKLVDYITNTLNIKQLISYSNNRWGNGLAYEKSGFKLIGETHPGYSYTDGKDREGRLAHKKNADLLDIGQTETEQAVAKGLFKIYDCGNKIWAIGDLFKPVKTEASKEEKEIQTSDNSNYRVNCIDSKTKIYVKCSYCLNHFGVFPSKFKAHKTDKWFCNKECESAYYDKEYTRKCPQCGQEFKATTRDQQYCSQKCSLDSVRHLAIASAKQNYTAERRSEVLKNKWAENKEEMLEKRNTEEYLSNLSKANKEKWTEELREKHSEIAVNIQSKMTPEQYHQRNIKRHETAKKNGSYFGPSQMEKEIYDLLYQIYPEVKTEYTDKERYPFACDFYIPKIDLFIECQGTWTHGTEPYDGKNLPEMWRVRSQTSEYYQNAIRVFTISDPEKRRIAKSNKLNYLELWSVPTLDQLKQNIDWALNGIKYSSTIEERIREFNKIKDKIGKLETEPQSNKIVLNYQPHFYERESAKFKDEIVKRKVIANRCKYLNKEESELTTRDILRGFKISGIYYGFSHFSPLWIKWFIEKYEIKSIYDPCAGWGQRLLGSHNIKYIGNDIDARTTEGLVKIKNEFNLNAYIYNNDATCFSPDCEYDAVFTCPPYFNVEEYTGENTSTKRYPSYEEWLKYFWGGLIDMSLIGCCKYFAFVVREDFNQDMIKECEKRGLVMVEIRDVGLNTSSHFTMSSKSRQKENLIIFQKL